LRREIKIGFGDIKLTKFVKANFVKINFIVHDGWVENLLKNMIENETFVLVKAIVNKEAILTFKYL
jgi:hypothetical protein